MRPNGSISPSEKRRCRGHFPLESSLVVKGAKQTLGIPRQPEKAWSHSLMAKSPNSENAQKQVKKSVPD
jgi:hypothetical protein